MENQINFIVNQARAASPYHIGSQEELEKVLKSNGSKEFTKLGDVLFSVNEYGIIEGIGFDSMGNFKIWNNRKFGTFKQEPAIINDEDFGLKFQIEELKLFNQKLAFLTKVLMFDFSFNEKEEICLKFDSVHTLEDVTKLYKEIIKSKK